MGYNCSFCLMRKICLFLFSVVFLGNLIAAVDYSMVNVPQEAGLEITRITADGDYVYLPSVNNGLIVKSGLKAIKWDASNVISISPDGSHIAYLSERGKTTNIFVKDLTRQGSSIQRTKRGQIKDFVYSPDGRYICFSEIIGKGQQVFQTDAQSGYVCRQFTSGAYDSSPIYSSDMSQIFFSRKEKKSASIWSYNISNNFLSTFTAGEYPYPLRGESAYYCTRYSADGRGEIWKVNYVTNMEECIVSDLEKGFTTPVLSPDRRWLLFVGESLLTEGKTTTRNLDIYVCRPDGTDLTQLTFHPANDMSPTWSADGRFIYFVSQRGSAEKKANIWRMLFLL